MNRTADNSNFWRNAVQSAALTLLLGALAGLGFAQPNASNQPKEPKEPKEKDEMELALAALHAGSAAAMKSRIFTTPLTVLNDEARARALAALPAVMRQARLTQGPELRRAEMNLQQVLALHERPRSAPVELFLLRDETAQARLWHGCVLVLSAGLVNALSDAELSGIIAHELGHSYFMDEMAVAQQARDSRTMRTVELKCDAVAILSLKLLGHDPALYLIGLLKLQAVTSRKGRSSGSIFQTHPEYGERALFYQRFIKSLR
jgi:Zn-dependent protease with chaperone function